MKKLFCIFLERKNKEQDKDIVLPRTFSLSASYLLRFSFDSYSNKKRRGNEAETKSIRRKYPKT